MVGFFWKSRPQGMARCCGVRGNQSSSVAEVAGWPPQRRAASHGVAATALTATFPPGRRPAVEKHGFPEISPYPVVALSQKTRPQGTERCRGVVTRRGGPAPRGGAAAGRSPAAAGGAAAPGGASAGTGRRPCRARLDGHADMCI
jgi:hypothetical protein